MQDPADGTTETLQAGPSRPPLFASVPPQWRQRATTPVAFVLGVAAGAAAVLWWPAEQEPAASPFRADRHDVELVLFDVVAPRAAAGERESDAGPVVVEGALLLSGSVTSTVSSIDLLGDSLLVRVPRLPSTVSPSDRFQSISVRISVQDCDMATRWVPADRPFIITWQDGFDREHSDRAGDFSKATGNALIRYIDSVCGG